MSTQFNAKLILITLMLMIAWAIDSHAQVFQIPTPTNEPVKNYEGQYVLITRSWDSSGCWTSNCTGPGFIWRYDARYFDTLKEAEDKLSEDCGTGYPCIRPVGAKESYGRGEFVGIYKLTLAVSRDQVKFSEGDKVQTHTVEQKDHWFKWELNGPDNGKGK